MSLSDMLERSMTLARELKEETVRDAKDQEMTPDIQMMLEGWRGSHPVVVMIPFEAGRPHVLQTGAILATMFACDVIVITHEGWQANSLTNPLTGKEWESGEMQDAVNNHQALEKGWIKEGLITYVVNRAGDILGGFQNFLVHGDAETGYSVEWTDTQTTGTEESDFPKLGGVIPEKLVEFMNSPTVEHAMAKSGLTPKDFDLTDVQARAHTDCAVVKNLTDLGWQGVVQLMADSEERAEVIEKSLGRSPMRRPDLE